MYAHTYIHTHIEMYLRILYVGHNNNIRFTFRSQAESPGGARYFYSSASLSSYAAFYPKQDSVAQLLVF